MSRPENSPAGGDGRFSLRDVTWGYRDIFRQTIEELYAAGCLGPEQQAVTETFFDALARADQSCFDHVLRQFLGALHPQNRWLMSLPALFADLVQTGCELAERRLHYGIGYFRQLAAGGFGQSPAEVRFCLDRMARLRRDGEEMAMAFLDGYAALRDRMSPDEIDRYLDVARTIRRRSDETARAFLRGELSTCETYIQSITQEARLADLAGRLEAMYRALCGIDGQIEDLGGLDSDELILRGSAMAAVRGRLYLPQRIRRVDNVEGNRKLYLLCVLLAACQQRIGAFATLHGQGPFSTCRDLLDGSPGQVNRFVVLDAVRTIRRARQFWPGAQRLIGWGLEIMRDAARPGDAMSLLLDAAEPDAPDDLAEFLAQADAAGDCRDLADHVDAFWTDALARRYPLVESEQIAPPAILSDPLLPMHFTAAGGAEISAESQSAPARQDDSSQADDADRPAGPASGQPGGTSSAEDAPVDTPATLATPWLYDEWDATHNEYRRDWCSVYPQRVASGGGHPPAAAWLDAARKVQRLFERLKPDLARREKYLAEGDTINTDELVRHLVDRRREPAPPVRFYEKPLIQHRDLAVLVLLDVSGSTGEQGATARVLDVEKQAVVILGQGLACLGDRFAICGFSSNGRQQCDFLEYKGFEECWGHEAIGRVMRAWPRNSTRMGPALRHAGAMLADEPHRQRLILLVTDGKPMDQGYDPAEGYAQHDVRMACEENARREVLTFGISTDENSAEDMALMFPQRRFALLPTIDRLPRILPELYLRLTM